MVTKIKLSIGAILIIILASAIYLTFGQVRIRVDKDQTTFYRPHETMPWIWTVAGREVSSLWDFPSKMNRELSNTNTTYVQTLDNFTAYRFTKYQRGPLIKETYFFDGAINNPEQFPMNHKIEIFNAKGYAYQYEVRDLIYNGETESLHTDFMNFGRNMKVIWDDSYYWAKVYKSGILKVRYKIDSDYFVLHNRLFDPSTLYLNGTSGNVNYELGNTANISYLGTGVSCISINVTGFKNINCSTNNVTYNFDTIARYDRFNSSLSINMTKDSQLSVANDTDFSNATFNLYGYIGDFFEWDSGVTIQSVALQGISVLGTDIYAIGTFGMVKIDTTLNNEITTIFTSAALDTPRFSDIFINESTGDIHIVYKCLPFKVCYRVKNGTTGLWGDEETILNLNGNAFGVGISVNDTHNAFVTTRDDLQSCIIFAERNNTGDWLRYNVSSPCNGTLTGNSGKNANSISVLDNQPHLCVNRINDSYTEFNMQHTFRNASGWRTFNISSVANNLGCEASTINSELYFVYKRGSNITLDRYDSSTNSWSNNLTHAPYAAGFAGYPSLSSNGVTKSILYSNRSATSPNVYEIILVNETSLGTWTSRVFYDENTNNYLTNGTIIKPFSDYSSNGISMIFGASMKSHIYSENDTAYTKNISIDIDGDGAFDLLYPGRLVGDTFYINETTDGNKTFTMQFNYSGTDNFIFFTPTNVSVVFFNITLNATSGSTNQQNLYDFYNFTSGSGARLLGYKLGLVGRGCSSDPPAISSTEFDDTSYGYVWADDGDTASYSTTSGSGRCIYHYIKYYVNEDFDRVNNVTVLWKGDVDSSSGAGESFNLKAWDYIDNEWDNLDSGTGVGTDTLLGTISNFTIYSSGKWIQVAVIMDAAGTFGINTDYTNLTVNVNISYPSNITVDVGFDGDTEYNMTGELNTTNSPLTIYGNITNLQNLINSTTGIFSTITVAITTDTGGTIDGHFDYRYNLTQQNGFTGVNATDTNGTLIFRADTWGNLEAKNLIADFFGDIAYNVSGNDTSHVLKVFYSNFTRVLPFTWTDHMFFMPRTNSSKNVTPFAQTTSTPILNITGASAKRGMVIGIKHNNSQQCLNFTFSNTSNVSDGFILSNTSFQTICNLTTSTSSCTMFGFLNMYNCNSSLGMIRPLLKIDSYCNGCEASW